jgi:RimJ/RimL family protein N-acetyltransferase
MTNAPRLRFVDPGDTLADEVVRIRRWRPTDAPHVHAACQDPEIARWIPPIPSPYLPDDAEAFLAGSIDRWADGIEAAFAIVDPATGDLLGAVGLHPSSVGRWEIGYWVAPWARRRGVATHAVRLVSGWAMRTYGLVRLALLTLDGNGASQGVAVAAGYRREGTLRNLLDDRGRPADAVVFSLVPGQPAGG